MITSNIEQRIIGKGRGAIFAPADFLDIGSRASVDQALSHLSDQGVIRRLTRGLYDYPKKSPRFGFLSPSTDDIAKAVARKDGQILQPSPSMAANRLSLSTQVPSGRRESIGRRAHVLGKSHYFAHAFPSGCRQASRGSNVAPLLRYRRAQSLYCAWHTCH